MDRLTLKLILITFVIASAAGIGGAQSFESPGYPWTYVPRQDLPTGVLDTAHERSLDTVSLLCPNSEIRRIFYVLAHPELTLGDSLGQFPIIVPREPGSPDTILMQKIYINSSQGSNFIFHSIGGLFSFDKPEYSSGDIELVCFYRENGDTSCSGYIARLPATYRFVNNFNEDPSTRWINIVQCVDSIWHPPLTSSSQEVLLGQMETMTVYPNPLQRGDRVYLKQPSDWPSGPSELVLTGPAGRVLFRRLIAGPPNEQGYALPADLAVGVYTLIAVSDGRKAATRVVVR